MTTKHTPGPWRVKHSAKLGWAGVLTEKGDIIADVALDGQDFRDPEQALVDARLIAAAPDLLAALHRISLASQNSMSSKEECGRIAREAIAKATRGKP